MASLLSFVKKKIVDPVVHQAQGVVAQVNPYDGGRTYNTVMQKGANYAPNPNQNVVQQATNFVQNAAPAVTRTVAPVTRFAPGLYDRVKTNPLIRADKTIALGLGRSGVGTVQGVSGLVDLASPGTGTNQVSQQANKIAEQLDAQARAMKANQALYRGAQAVGDIGTAIATGGASKAVNVPRVLPVVNQAAERFVANKTANLAAGNFGQRVAAQTIRNAAKPGYQAANLGYSSLQWGKDASKGNDISPQRVATDLTLSGLAFPLGGAVASQSIRSTANKVLPALDKATGQMGKVEHPEFSYTNKGGKFKQTESASQAAESLRNKIAAARQGMAETNRIWLNSERGSVPKGSPLLPFGGKSTPRNRPEEMADNMPRQTNQDYPQSSLQDQGQVPRPEQSQTQLPLPSVGQPKNRQAVSETFSSNETIPSLAKDVETALNNGNKVKQKSLNTRLSNNEGLPDHLRTMLDGTYVVRDNKTTIKDASDLIFRDQQSAEIRALAPKNAVDVEIGAQLFRKYADQGDFQKAVDFVNASDSTNAGQMIQILSKYDRTTPQGAIRFAQAAINNFNKSHKGTPLELGESDIKAIHDAASAVQEMPKGTARNVAAKQLMDMVNQLIPSSKTDKALTIWKAGLLTSPRTHLRNLLGNTVHAAGEIAKDPIAAVNDRVLKLKTGQRSMSATVRGTASGAKEGAGVAKEVFRTGFDPTDDIVKYDIQKVNWGKNPFEQAMKHYTDTVFNLLGAEDKVFYHSALKRSLYDQAITQARNVGKKSDKKFIENLANNPTPEMLKTATQEASVATFKDKNKLTEIAGFVKNKARGNAVSKALAEITMPFTGVPSSVASQMINYSPIGLAKGLAKDSKILRGKVKTSELAAMQRKASQEVGRGVVGTGLMGVAAYLTANGMMTGQPKDAEEARLWEAQGKQANSLYINGKYRSINSVGPEALIALAGSKFAQGKGAVESVANIGKDFLGQTFMQGVQSPLNAVNEPDRYGQTYISSQVSSGIPNIVKDTAKAFDSTKREIVGDGIYESSMNAIKGSFPGSRNKLLPARDALGNPVKQQPTGFNAYVDLLNTKTPTKNPLANELARLYGTDNGATPSKLKAKQSIDGQKVKLTMQQLDSLEKESGGLLSSELTKLFARPEYKNAPDEKKSESITKLTNSVRKQVKLDQYQRGGWQGDAGYEHSSDAPDNIFETAGLYGSALIHDPVQNAPNIAKGIFTSEQARKMTGNTLILERKKGLSTMDGGNENAQVDHKIALAIGGDNNRNNFQYLSNEDNQKKGQFEVKLMKQLEEKKINRAEAIRQAKEYMKNLKTVQPGSGKTSASAVDSSALNALGVDTKQKSDKKKSTAKSSKGKNTKVAKGKSTKGRSSSGRKSTGSSKTSDLVAINAAIQAQRSGIGRKVPKTTDAPHFAAKTPQLKQTQLRQYQTQKRRVNLNTLAKMR